MTRFDDTDLDRLFRQLGSDLADDGFDARLHAALVAESVPAAGGGWGRWGRRTGTVIALAAIPLAAAAAVGSQWTPASPPTESVAARAQLAPPAPTRDRALEGPREPSTTSVAISKAPATEPVSPAEAVRVRTRTPPRVTERVAPIENAVGPGEQLEERVTEKVAAPAASDPPRIERVRLVTTTHGSMPEAAPPPPARVAPSPAPSTPTRAKSATSETPQRADRERARERRQRETLPARERRQAGPHLAR